MVDPVGGQEIFIEAFGDRPLGLEKKVIDDGVTVKCLLASIELDVR